MAFIDPFQTLGRLHLVTGRFLEANMPWDGAAILAVRLSEDFCHKIGARGFDILHVAAALELNIKDFITCDRRQATLAKAAGLDVVLVHRE